MRLAPYMDAHQRAEGVVVTFIDVTSLVQSEERQRLLVNELHHRTRNLLGVVQTVANRTLAGDPALADLALGSHRSAERKASLPAPPGASSILAK